VNSNQNKPDLTNKDTKTGIKKTTPQTGKEGRQKQQQTKTTKHTIEFSNNTPARPRNEPAAKRPRTSSADNQEPNRSWGFPLGAAALFGPGPCRSDSDKLREG
jgi:hypothetical protein